MFKIAGPLMIQYTVSHSVSMTGTAFVGHLDDPVLLSAMVGGWLRPGVDKDAVQVDCGGGLPAGASRRAVGACRHQPT